jgi:hypothetical protein
MFLFLADANTSNLLPLPSVTKAVESTGITGVSVDSIINAATITATPVVTKGVNWFSYWWVLLLLLLVLGVGYIIKKL